MLGFPSCPDVHMKSKLNMESLTKSELLMLFSILEGELEARDLVIDALKAQRKDLFVQERYGRYNLSDPFLALQRDGEVVGGQSKDANCLSTASNPLVVLKLVVNHCKRMREKMLAQLAAAESRHRRVIADLEEEKRRHAADTAEGDDVTYVLEKERERLQQQLEFERSQVRRLEKDQRRISDQLEEERSQHKQLSCALAKECKWASTRALEDGHRVTELNRKLEKEKETSQVLRKELEDERKRALRMEARVEEQLAEFDTEREQLRSRLKKEEAQCHLLKQQVGELRRDMEELNLIGSQSPGHSTTDPIKVDDVEEDEFQPPEPPKVNGHHCPVEINGHLDPPSCLQNGVESPPVCQSQILPESPPSIPPTHPSCVSPVLNKCVAGNVLSPGNYQSTYQAGINQRFHAARHKFQGTVDQEPPSVFTQTAPPLSPKEPSCSSTTTTIPTSLNPTPTNIPTTTTLVSPPETSPVKQLARSTVTQVLSRFTTVQQNAAPKLNAPNNSPFGTDYRSLAAPLSPVVGRAAAAVNPGMRSPVISRADRGNPPPIPPKKPGLAQAPPSPAAVPRSVGHFSDGPLAGSCGLISGQEGVKELDMVVSSN